MMTGRGEVSAPSLSNTQPKQASLAYPNVLRPSGLEHRANTGTTSSCCVAEVIRVPVHGVRLACQGRSAGLWVVAVGAVGGCRLLQQG